MCGCAAPPSHTSPLLHPAGGGDDTAAAASNGQLEIMLKAAGVPVQG